MVKFSIVCIVSNPLVFEECLLHSIDNNRLNHEIEIIPIFNDGNLYSASVALNIGIDVSNSDIVIFAHQDVKFLYNWFDKLSDVIDELDKDWGVIGSAGISSDFSRNDIGRWGGALNVDTVAVGSVWNSDLNLGEVPYWDGTKDTCKVHCLDECVLVLNKKTGLKFDNQFDGFHFYGVDVCLQARAAGYGVYGAHLPIIHYGKYSGSFNSDKKYWVYLRLLYYKWSNQFPEVLGTHFHWSYESKRSFYGELEIIPEITSYIDISMVSNDGIDFSLKAMTINKVEFKTDNMVLN